MNQSVVEREEKTVIAVDSDYGKEIPDFAIERMARFFLPLMQASLSDPKSTHLQQEQETSMITKEEECV